MDAGQLHRIARILREVAAHAAAGPDERPVSAGDLAVTSDVAEHPGTSVGQISRRTGLAQSLVSKTVATMRDAGVFATADDPDDGRRLLIRLSSSGQAEALRGRAVQPIRTALAEVLPNSSEVELTRVEKLLDGLGRHLLR